MSTYSKVIGWTHTHTYIHTYTHTHTHTQTDRHTHNHDENITSTAYAWGNNQNLSPHFSQAELNCAPYRRRLPCSLCSQEQKEMFSLKETICTKAMCNIRKSSRDILSANVLSHLLLFDTICTIELCCSYFETLFVLNSNKTQEIQEIVYLQFYMPMNILSIFFYSDNEIIKHGHCIFQQWK